MKRDYDFSKRTKNPYASKLPKQQVAIRLDAETNAYFTQMAQKYGISVEDLINLYLTDCVKKNRVLEYSFPEPSR
jgi:antitoxin component of RelBE/YafQ-DinJ toxin-antitoxin module